MMDRRADVRPLCSRAALLLLVLLALCQAGGSDEARVAAPRPPPAAPSPAAPVAAEDRIKLKTRQWQSGSREGGVGVGEGADGQATAQPRSAPGAPARDGSWRDKAAERLGLVRETGRSGGGGRGGGAGPAPAEAPAVVYQARSGRTEPDGRSREAKAAALAAAAAANTLLCNVTLACHACPEASIADRAEYCLPTGWRQQVRCLRRGVEVEVRFEPCKHARWRGAMPVARAPQPLSVCASVYPLFLLRAREAARDRQKQGKPAAALADFSCSRLACAQAKARAEWSQGTQLCCRWKRSGRPCLWQAGCGCNKDAARRGVPESRPQTGRAHTLPWVLCPRPEPLCEAKRGAEEAKSEREAERKSSTMGGRRRWKLPSEAPRCSLSLSSLSLSQKCWKIPKLLEKHLITSWQ